MLCFCGVAHKIWEMLHVLEVMKIKTHRKITSSLGLVTKGPSLVLSTMFIKLFLSFNFSCWIHSLECLRYHLLSPDLATVALSMYNHMLLDLKYSL